MKSKIVLWLLIAWLAGVGIFKHWENPLSWDVFGYHLYLPATFIWHDVLLKNFSEVEKVHAQYKSSATIYQGDKTDSGNWLIKYTMGLAFVEAPFFFVAHLLAAPLGYPADGFSIPYQAAFMVMHFVFVFLGLIFLRKALLKIFNETITSLLLLAVALGTNYYVMALLTGGSTPVHTVEFALFSMLLYYTIRFHELASMNLAIMLGLLSGLIILVRPSDGVVLLLPFLWNVNSLKSLVSKFTGLFSHHLPKLLAAGVACFIVLLPQLLYWNAVAGKWLVFGYANNPGEGFTFLSPYIMEVLFSFRKGWLLYTPMMIFAITGFYTLYKSRPGIFWPAFIFFLLNLYVVSSWSCWWYAGSFGQRAMVDSYPVLLLPLGALAEELFRHKTTKNILLAGMGIFTVLNLFQSWQYSAGIIDSSRMTAKYYARVFGKTQASAGDRKLLMIERSTGEAEVFSDEDDYRSRVLFSDNFDNPRPDIAYQYKSGMQKEGSMCLQMDSTFIYTPKLEAPYSTITRRDHAWIRTSFWYNPLDTMQETLLSLVVAFNHNGEMYKYKAVDVGLQPGEHPVVGQWNKFSFDYLTPEVRSDNDEVNIYLWLRGKKSLFIDDMKVEVFERK